MLKTASLLIGAAALVQGAPGQSTAQLQRIPARAPIHAGTFHAASGQFIPADPTQQSSMGAGGDVYTNNYYAAVFLDINSSSLVVDEGRIPSTTSPATTSPEVSITGTQDSYRINNIQLGYATDSMGDGTARLSLLPQYDSCTSPLGTGAPILDLIISGLPGTILAGAITPYTFDVDMTGFEFCMPADGDGKYDDGVIDNFGFGLLMAADPGSQIGPLIGSRPGPFAPTGDGTTFQNPGGVGSGLGTLDQWFELELGTGATNCYNEGGYDPVTNNPSFGSFWLVLGADLGFDCSGCASREDDVFEDNDDCNSAAPLTAPSVNSGLVVTKTDPDYYAIDIPAGMSLTANALFSQAQADVDTILYNEDCTVALDFGFSITDNETVAYTNCTASSITVKLAVTVFLGSFGDCSDYDLELLLTSLCADDPLAGNDSCATAFSLSTGLTVNLVVNCVAPSDYFRLSLIPGETINVTMTLDPTEADLDLLLFTDNADCDDVAGFIDGSFNVGATESISYTNKSGQPQTYVLKVATFQFQPGESCANYVLDYNIGASTELGSNFCSAVLNSSGFGAHMFATGSDLVADNAFTLNAECLPNNSSGYFFVSQGSIFVPNVGSSTGNLCIGGGPVGRFLASVVNSGSGTSVTVLTDLTMWPQPTGTVSVIPGDSYNFQYWFRDIGSTSNFSDALSVTFQ
ncbi:MAG: hypothetical protein P8R43_00235 [Planctomycetota bacterium]|nr:hypothetical protein [Planctomycetota bacterium]